MRDDLVRLEHVSLLLAVALSLVWGLVVAL
jgi:hypothetical protein